MDTRRRGYDEERVHRVGFLKEIEKNLSFRGLTTEPRS